ncbi:hypothetical protein EGW08_009893 [Elysia chlorotica]|uniref:Uncharacterized protein n=1 Tax=Elysia chlorotica TaxID=188477 RepID=A0A3S1BEQ8_ELYCH|nr:hypothetical protein EGW08_009893 [Elysia chlorotica]
MATLGLTLDEVLSSVDVAVMATLGLTLDEVLPPVDVAAGATLGLTLDEVLPPVDVAVGATLGLTLDEVLPPVDVAAGATLGLTLDEVLSSADVAVVTTPTTWPVVLSAIVVTVKIITKRRHVALPMEAMTRTFSAAIFYGRLSLLKPSDDSNVAFLVKK